MEEPLVETRELKKYFPLTQFGQSGREVKAVDGVDLKINHGENFALVGESGSGKTTTSKLILRLIEPTSGTILFDGVVITDLGKREMRKMRREMQMVYQDSLSSFNPRKTVRQVLMQPFTLNGYTNKAEITERVHDLLTKVGLTPPESFLERHPSELSGGQRQRVDIARAIALRPKFIVADEPVSSLDTSVRALILNLFLRLQEELNLTYLFITHDMAVVRAVSDRVAVMYLGKVMETGTVEEIFLHPAHPYTIALLSATPIPDPEVARARKPIVLKGAVPSPIDPPSGCRFRTRCPLAVARCAEPIPEFRLSESHGSYCIFAEELSTGRKVVASA